jgi:uncharacterized protein YjbJ (UPF0337 family)
MKLQVTKILAMPDSRQEGTQPPIIDGLTSKQQREQLHGLDEIERSWNELKGEAKRQWSKLTDEDLELIKGKYAELLGLLQERYGHAKERAEREMNDWSKRLKVYGAAELTALRDDVAGLSASVGELVPTDCRSD